MKPVATYRQSQVGATHQSPELTTARDSAVDDQSQISAVSSVATQDEEHDSIETVPRFGQTDRSAAAAMVPPSDYNVVSVRNIFARVDLECRIDLKHVALKARNAEYHPKRFAAVIMRIRDPSCTAMIYASGKMVTVGTHDENDARIASRKFARIMQKLGYDAQHKNFAIMNVMAVVTVPPTLSLEAIRMRHHNFATFEPEIFAGLIYRFMSPKMVIFIFENGKLVFTGAKSRQDIQYALDQMIPMLDNFRNVRSLAQAIS
ncbi:MAG: TATA-box-binding protein [Chrysothrix sp. TS-e1954]|nr:MAG: TATA-box-binding protein [Chrysothrix sp. TS-e1954]